MIKLFFFSFYLATFFLPQIAGATDRCDHALKKHRLGAQFLNGRNAKLHNTDFVNKISRLRAYPELSPSSAPVDKLSLWLEHMEKTHFPKKNREEVNPRSENEAVTRATDDGPNNRAAASGQISKIKKYYLRRHVIQPQGVPESYFDFQKRIARERGDNDFEISDWERQERIKQIIAGQKRSLEIWLDYLLSEDTAMYPMWSKYWVFTGLVKLGLFEKEKGRFTKRTPSTVAPFPELNREALAYVIDGVIKTVHKESLESIQDPIFLKLLEKKSDFGSLYIQALRRTMGEIHSLATVSGQWITYKQGSDHRPLFESLQGKNTGWCTAGETIARQHLDDGNFYVYYSHDYNGAATNPRIAIHMMGSRIAEVRGVGPEQHLDFEIARTPILSDKMKEFGIEGERYQTAADHMKLLTAIDDKQKKGLLITTNELRFLYEIDEPIQTFGYDRDERIDEITSKRNVKDDLSKLLGVPQELISTTLEEALSGNIVYHRGDLDLSGLQNGEGLRLPQRVWGSVILSNLRSAKGIVLPQRVDRDVDLSKLESAEGLILPQYAGGSVDIGSLQVAKDLILPQYAGGSVDIGSLQVVENLILPRRVGGDVLLGSLISANSIKLPQFVEKSIVLTNLKSAKGVIFSETVGGGVDLSSLTSAKGLKLSHTIGGFLDLSSLTSARGLKLSRSIGEDLDLSSLTSANGLVLPEIMGGGVFLGSLKSAKNIKFPQSVGGGVYLGNLVKAEEVILPQDIAESLELSSLRSAKGIIFPLRVAGDVDLSSLESPEGLTPFEEVGGSLDISGLKSTEGLKLPQKVGRKIHFNTLQSGNGATLPETVEERKLMRLL